jgi:hypothetical protein
MTFDREREHRRVPLGALHPISIQLVGGHLRVVAARELIPRLRKLGE